MQLTQLLREVTKLDRDRQYWKREYLKLKKELHDTEGLLKWYQYKFGQKECS